MTPNKKIFCNTPWFETHIYWDGSFGICCQENHKLYSDSSNYNIRTMTIRQWFNSDPVRLFRSKMFGSLHNSECVRCYKEETVSNTSRRHRSNQKSVIFTKTAFNTSYEQSPHLDRFVSFNQLDSVPVDLHVDLGNFCNLACKMCVAQASSTIAVQEVAWGIESSRSYIGNDWTRDPEVWNRFLKEIATFSIENIHFMGGETLATNKIQQLAEALIKSANTDCGISFVTNGTKYNEKLLEALINFRRVGIEISIETVSKHNNYIRQGSNLCQVLENIKKFQSWCFKHSNINLTLRPAISALSIGYIDTLLEYCLTEKILLKSLIVDNPVFLHPGILPDNVKNLYKLKLDQFYSEHNLDNIDIENDFNESDPNEYRKVIKLVWTRARRSLNYDKPGYFKTLLEHCQRWDKVYNFDMHQLYPEFC